MFLFAAAMAATPSAIRPTRVAHRPFDADALAAALGEVTNEAWTRSPAGRVQLSCSVFLLAELAPEAGGATVGLTVPEGRRADETAWGLDRLVWPGVGDTRAERGVTLFGDDHNALAAAVISASELLFVVADTDTGRCGWVRLDVHQLGHADPASLELHILRAPDPRLVLLDRAGGVAFEVRTTPTLTGIAARAAVLGSPSEREPRPVARPYHPTVALDLAASPGIDVGYPVTWLVAGAQLSASANIAWLRLEGDTFFGGSLRDEVDPPSFSLRAGLTEDRPPTSGGWQAGAEWVSNPNGQSLGGWLGHRSIATEFVFDWRVGARQFQPGVVDGFVVTTQVRAGRPFRLGRTRLVAFGDLSAAGGDAWEGRLTGGIQLGGSAFSAPDWQARGRRVSADPAGPGAPP